MLPKNHSRRGGKRPGAGRPKGKARLDKEAARALLREMVTAKLTPLVEAQIENARGLKYLVVRDKASGKFIRVTEAMARAKQGTHEETIEVWEKDPSIQAFTDLMNRAIDKPAEQAQDFNVNVGFTDEAERRLKAARDRVSNARNR